MSLRIPVCLYAHASLTMVSAASTIRFTPHQPSDFEITGTIVYPETLGMASSAITNPPTGSPNTLRIETLITPSGQAIYTHEWLGAAIIWRRNISRHRLESLPRN